MAPLPRAPGLPQYLQLSSIDDTVVVLIHAVKPGSVARFLLRDLAVAVGVERLHHRVQLTLGLRGRCGGRSTQTAAVLKVGLNLFQRCEAVLVLGIHGVEDLRLRILRGGQPFVAISVELLKLLLDRALPAPGVLTSRHSEGTGDDGCVQWCLPVLFLVAEFLHRSRIRCRTDCQSVREIPMRNLKS